MRAHAVSGRKPPPGGWPRSRRVRYRAASRDTPGDRFMPLPSLPISPELGYVALIFVLFVVPKVLQRLRLPAAITSLAIGLGFGAGLGLFVHDPTVHLLSTLGIVALFLFAGLEVDVRDLRLGAWIILQHLIIRAVLLYGVGWLVWRFLHLGPRASALVALALLTPSTGFILDSIGAISMSERERFWIKTKAITTELLALLVLFATLQSTTALRLSISVVVLAGMILVLPAVFRWFAQHIARHAPRSEFAFLLMVAVVCAYVTRELGVYYLVGAFVVGMAAQRFRRHLPAMASENLVHAVELFASFFVPFYFFNAGLELQRQDFSLEALVYGLGFLAVAIPLRIGVVMLHRRVALREPPGHSARIAFSLLPTLVFGLVLSAILRDRFHVSPALFGGLIVYTLVSTLLPSLVLHLPAPDYLQPHAPAVDPEQTAAMAKLAAGHRHEDDETHPAHRPAAQAPTPRPAPGPPPTSDSGA